MESKYLCGVRIDRYLDSIGTLDRYLGSEGRYIATLATHTELSRYLRKLFRYPSYSSMEP